MSTNKKRRYNYQIIHLCKTIRGPSFSWIVFTLSFLSYVLFFIVILRLLLHYFIYSNKNHKNKSKNTMILIRSLLYKMILVHIKYKKKLVTWNYKFIDKQTYCLKWFYKNLKQMFPLSSLYECLWMLHVNIPI